MSLVSCRHGPNVLVSVCVWFASQRSSYDISSLQYSVLPTLLPAKTGSTANHTHRKPPECFLADATSMYISYLLTQLHSACPVVVVLMPDIDIYLDAITIFDSHTTQCHTGGAHFALSPFPPLFLCRNAIAMQESCPNPPPPPHIIASPKDTTRNHFIELPFLPYCCPFPWRKKVLTASPPPGCPASRPSGTPPAPAPPPP